MSWQENSLVNPIQQNKLPITFNLPLGVPSSFRLKWKNLNKDCSCDIIYYIKAYLIPPSENYDLNTTMPGLTQTKKFYFEVLQSQECIGEQSKMVINDEIKKFGCVFQGFIDISAKLDKQYYYPDDVAKLYIHANNTFSLVDIECIRVSLKHVLEVRTNQTSWSFTNQGTSLVTNGVECRGNRSGNDPFLLKLPLTKAFGCYRNNTQGKLITNKYVLFIEVFLKGSCFRKGNSFTGQMDLRIVDESGHNMDKLNEDIPEDYEAQVMFQNELDWKPMEYNNFLCSLTDQFKINKQEDELKESLDTYNSRLQNLKQNNHKTENYSTNNYNTDVYKTNDVDKNDDVKVNVKYVDGQNEDISG